MEFCANRDLITYIGRFGAFPQPIARALFKELLDGLMYIHANEIIHRDIKPDNLFLTSDGTIKIGDFGSALGGDHCTVTYGMTRSYAPPEAFRADYSGRAADLFAAGCILYILVTGRPPFRRASRSDPLYNQLCLRAT
jgi:serine/threonine protein kinase